MDPEHPYTLEQLNVVSEDAVACDEPNSHVKVKFTPTVQHCSMATLIGLSIRVKLLRCLPARFKQLNDKERVAAALENPHLVDMVDRCLASSVEE
eukprot:jgi/Mesen1/8284/ME000045S07741